VEKDVLLKIVRDAIEEEFGGEKIDKEQYYLKYPEFKKKMAVFVTKKRWA